MTAPEEVDPNDPPTLAAEADRPVMSAELAAMDDAGPPERAPGLFALADRVRCPIGTCGSVHAFDRIQLSRHLALMHDSTIVEVEAAELAKQRPAAEVPDSLPPRPSTDEPRALALYLLEVAKWSADHDLDADTSGLTARAQVFATIHVGDQFDRLMRVIAGLPPDPSTTDDWTHDARS